MDRGGGIGVGGGEGITKESFKLKHIDKFEVIFETANGFAFLTGRLHRSFDEKIELKNRDTVHSRDCRKKGKMSSL